MDEGTLFPVSLMEQAWCKNCDKFVNFFQCFQSNGTHRRKKVIMRCCECRYCLGKPAKKDLRQAIINQRRYERDNPREEKNEI